MKIGFNTASCGIKINNIEQTLDIIAEAGYQGVEFAQRHDALGVQNIHELMSLLRERNLSFLSIDGGTLKERINFCQTYHPEYLYMDPWEIEKIPLVTQYQFKPALHPRAYTSIRRYTDINAVLDKYDKLQLLFDTAHATIAGDRNLKELVRKFCPRLAAVHLKDWTPIYGRSAHRYARGFTELGNGMVQLDSVVHQLQECNYNRWVVVELDNLYKDLQAIIGSSAEWLSRRKLLPFPKLPKRSNNEANLKQQINREEEFTAAEACFRENIAVAGTQTAETFYKSVAEAFNKLIPCKTVRIWAFSPTQGYMALRTCCPTETLDHSEYNRIKPNKLLSAVAVYRQASATLFDLTIEQPAAMYGFPELRFQNQELQKNLKLERLISLPVYNLGNHNYVRLLINLYPQNANCSISQQTLYRLGRAITIAADCMLDGLCSVAAAEVNLAAGQCSALGDYLERLKELIQNHLNCEGLTIFLVDETKNKLELAATTGIRWFAEDEFYVKGEGLTGKVWERNEPFLSVDAYTESGVRVKSEELVTTGQNHVGLWIPLVDAKGEVIGIIRCRNRRRTASLAGPNMFSEEDAAVLEAIGQAAAPHLLILLAEKRRANALTRLTHELRVPLVAIRGAAEFMLRTRGVESFFDYNYPGDVHSWSELMRRLLGQADILRYRPGQIPIQATPTLLMADVIAPAVKQVDMYLRERGFSSQKIAYRQNFAEIPRLWIDRNYFQQIIFNLLANAIKHCYFDPDSFEVEILGQRRGDMFIIRFRDWGPGIYPGMEESIFEEGFRTPDAIERNITGDGLGLWVVRQLVEAHGGEVKVTKRHLPTEFTIYLPDELSQQPPILKEKAKRSFG